MNKTFNRLLETQIPTLNIRSREQEIAAWLNDVGYATTIVGNKVMLHWTEGNVVFIPVSTMLQAKLAVGAFAA